MADNEIKQTGEEIVRDGHKLTEAEMRRDKALSVREAALFDEGYTRKDLTISIEKANTIGLLATLPAVAAIIIVFYAVNHRFGIQSLLDDHPALYFVYLLIFIVSFVVLAVVHEGIHGLVWGLGAEDRFKSIEFGFIKEKLTPYCTCASPLSKPRYILGSLMPMTVLGIGIGVLAIITGHPLLLAISAVQTVGGAGDLLISMMLITHKSDAKETIILDHPTEVGLILYER